MSNAVNWNFDGIFLSQAVSDNIVQDNTANGNASIGIAIAATATKNDVSGNTARGNALFDLTEGNPCGSNNWKNNNYETGGC